MPEFVPTPSNPRFQDLTGREYGRWKVLGYAGRRKNQPYFWCQCSCGSAPQTRQAGALKRGLTRSCRCLARERMRTHGLSDSVEYRLWMGMLMRCHNPRRACYARYGGRGIVVCERWRHSFEAFLADVGSRPEPGLTLERIDNEQGYRPGNVRWATRAEQNRNRRDTRLLTCWGETRTLAEWSERTGIHPGTIWRRLSLGWSPEKALSEPPRERWRLWRDELLTCRGESLTLMEWANRLGAPISTVCARITRGWSVEEAVSEPVRPGVPKRCRRPATPSPAPGP